MDRQEMRLRCLEAAARLSRVYLDDATLLASAAAFATWVGPSDSEGGRVTAIPPPIQPISARATLGVSNKK